MALESGTYISDLVATNPPSGDPVSQADDHLRLLKSTVKATFPNISSAVTPTHTELNYVAGVTSAIQTQINQATLTSGTAQASTSGATIDFLSIPSWVKRITVMLDGVSTTGTSNIIVQIGTSGGVETSSYTGGAANVASGPSITQSNNSNGFLLTASVLAADGIQGSATLTKVSSNLWTYSGVCAFSGSSGMAMGAGSKNLSGTLDRLRLTTVGGVNTFDVGTVNIQYE
jgi:hypothetical protein